MRYGPISHRDFKDVFFGRLGPLAYGLGDLAGLASTKSHSAIAVANYDHCTKAEAPTALAHVRNSLDAVLDDNFAQLCTSGIGFRFTIICFRHAVLP